MQHVTLIPVMQATTTEYFVDKELLAPAVHAFSDDDLFKRGQHFSSALKAGIEIPFTLLCKLNCDHWTANDGLSLTGLRLKELFFLATDKVTGKSAVLTMGSLFGVATATAMRPTFAHPTDNRIINFSMRHFSTKLLKDYRTGSKTDIFGEENGQTIHFNFIADINEETLTSSAEVTKCSNKDVELTIIGFNLYADHYRIPSIA